MELNHKHFHEVIKLMEVDRKTFALAWSLKEQHQARELYNESCIHIKDFFLTKIFNKSDKNDMKLKEDFCQQLIADYKSIASNKRLQQETSIWDETLNDAWKTKNSPKVKKNE